SDSSSGPITTTAPGSGGSTSVAPEDLLVGGDAVIAGLADAKLLAAAVQTSYATDPSTASAGVTALYARWFEFEGTIRKVDQSRYLDMEDALGSVKAGVDAKSPDRLAKVIVAFGKLADAYLVDHPDGGKVTPSESVGQGTVVNIELNEFHVIASVTSVAGGTVTFTSKNTGALVHELVLFKTDLDASDLPLDEDGAVDEKGAGLELIDEVEDVKPSETKSFTVAQLEPGKYLLVCNVVEGTVKHFMQGMYTTFSVT
ncbi:MAG: hypothetical protein ABIQ39_08410, partial [Ilumatobacteraceae bacterium]